MCCTFQFAPLRVTQPMCGNPCHRINVRGYVCCLLFPETPNGFSLKLNISHVQNGVYRTIGRMMSTMIVQGGEPPAFLSPHVVDYIVTGDILQAQATIDDVSDHELREDLNKVLLE